MFESVLVEETFSYYRTTKFHCHLSIIRHLQKHVSQPVQVALHFANTDKNKLQAYDFMVFFS